MLAKAGSSGADALLVDLEDGVAPGEKEAARAHVRAAVSGGEIGSGTPWMLRVNGAATAWRAEDIALARETAPARVVVSKAEEQQDVLTVTSALAGRVASIGLMIETARGVGNARELAGCGAVDLLVVGSADLRLSMGARPDPDRGWERHALWEVLLAARMHGAVAVDAVYFRYRDASGLERHARIARELGYDGGSCIHPEQVPTVNAAYASAPHEIAWARAVLDAWGTGGGDSRGVVAMDGEMIEALHVRVAERILARA